MVGLLRKFKPVRFIAALAAAAVAITLAFQPATTTTVSAECVFPFTPTSYEDLKNRKLFLDTIELASFDMLFPGDPYFGLGQIETGQRTARKTEAARVPPVLLKSISWIESSITNADLPVPFGSVGPALVSFDCGHGVTQVTSGMTVPTGESGRGSPQQALVATNFAYNIARGARILVDKWNEAPENRPIVGIDTNAAPQLLENWYYAVWSYNGFTGPGANRSNHPMDPIYGAWPRPAYSCGSQGDGKGHNRANYPYQELVIGCAAHPPVVDGNPLWSSQTITLPDLNHPSWKDRMSLANFVFPYPKMDIPTPQSFHTDNTERPNGALRDQILGSPQLGISRDSVKLGVADGGNSTVEIVEITNGGSGVLSWYATTTSPWLKIAPYTGVAVGANLPCEGDNPCERKGKMEFSVDVTKLPGGSATATVIVQGLGTNQERVINVSVTAVTRVGAPGITRN